VQSQEQERNELAYRQLEERIGHAYPRGHFVAIAGGQIVGHADVFLTLHEELKALGHDPRNVLIVQAGHVYPREAVIFWLGRSRDAIA
jgi:hypothetical protein